MLVFVVLVVASWGVWSFMDQGPPLAQALSRLGPASVALALVLACLSLALRAWRWQLILRRMGHRLPWRLLVRTYLAGLALSSTPGKVGETSRAVLLHGHGVPVANTLGAFVCDRLADVVAVAALGAGSAWVVGHRWISLEALLILSLLGGCGAAMAWLSPAGQRARRWTARRWLDERWQRRLAPWVAPLTAWARAWNNRQTALWVLMAALAYGLQAIVFFQFVARVHPGVELVRCVEIFCSSILVGAASLVPGGLGAMDAALIWQLQSAGVPLSAAMVATLATRACTLWFAWMVGLLAWTSFGHGATPQGQR